MLQPRILLRQSRTAACKNLPRKSALPRYYATVVEPVKPSPPTGAAASSGFAPPPTVDEGNATFMMRTYKPRTPGVRHLKRPINDHLWKGRPFLPLTFAKKGHGKGGRNNSGRVTMRHRGGGHKRRIRTVDFVRMAPGKHSVERIEHDPGRSAHIALLNEEATGRKSYIVAAEGMRAGDVVQSYRAGIPRDLLESMGGVVDPGVLAARTAWRGNCLPLHMIPIGTIIYNVGSTKGKGAVFCRSAGTYATVISKDDETTQGGNKYVNVRLQSGEIRKVSKDACATIGVASNPNYQHRQLGKAGRSRWLNIRPTVRGLAMNAADHPHGGGRGKSKGNVNPVSPWGMPAKGGYKTRKVRKPNKWVVTARERNHGKRRVK
ncbi:related to mitochondrial ribosomal protein L2 of the large subunit [Phialocephala subalpina]|uniref:Large ribosomal subunit protein uL2m n=1 Tax=Phialocephala subalpina TaxID=576137 RepID=A0A1L7X7A4_9HELO|nr:related to mitochondrial ribosomal protein L2 of the large subunit [Phialocephala subalpina]